MESSSSSSSGYDGFEDQRCLVLHHLKLEQFILITNNYTSVFSVKMVMNRNVDITTIKEAQPLMSNQKTTTDYSFSLCNYRQQSMLSRNVSAKLFC